MTSEELRAESEAAAARGENYSYIFAYTDANGKEVEQPCTMLAGPAEPIDNSAPPRRIKISNGRFYRAGHP